MSWVTDAANGLFVSSTRMDTDTNDIAAGLSNCICKDGQTTVTANIPMAGFKFTGLGLGTAATDVASVSNANSQVSEFRLTLTTGLPVTTSDVIGATTIFCTPYKGNHIALYDGSAWHMRTSSEFSLALGTLTSGKPYDVFCFDSAGVPTLEFLAWTNDTTRATALVYQDGVLSKSGATTRRYLGTFYTTSTTQTEDSVANRYLWNYYNRVVRIMRALTGANHNYTTATIRQYDGAAANQLNFFVGVSEDLVSAEAFATTFNTSASAVQRATGIGLNSTTTFATGLISIYADTSSASLLAVTHASLRTTPAAGKNFLAWLEWSTAVGTTTWVGTSATNNNPGISGSFWA